MRYQINLYYNRVISLKQSYPPPFHSSKCVYYKLHKDALMHYFVTIFANQIHRTPFTLTKQKYRQNNLGCFY